jgi:hypothetical protein
MPCRPSVLLLLPLLGLTQCLLLPDNVSMPEDKMPAATQTGANTAGCFVDGIVWVPRQNGFAVGGNSSPIIVHWGKVRGGQHPLSLVLIKNIDDVTHVHGETHLSLYLPDITQPGTFALDQPANPSVVNGSTAYADFNFNRSPTKQLRTGPGAPGRLVVTRLDTSARVVSGTFEFTPVEVTSGLTGNGTPISGGKTARITEGRFDCKF